MRTSFALVFNARAGPARAKMLDRVLARLKIAGASVLALPASDAGEASRRVAELAGRPGAVDAVIAAGGDGTFRAVATGAANSDLAVGFLPIGTGNVLACELGLQRRADALVTGLLQHPVVSIQGGLSNEAPFFLMVGAGHDARIVQDLHHGTKRVLGRAAYASPVMKAMARRPQMFDVDVDGRQFCASWVIVTRVSHYGGAFLLTRDTALGRAQMIAVVIEAKTRAQLFAASAALALGFIALPSKRPAGVTVLPATRVLIGGAAVPVQVDGDEAGSTPTEIVANGPMVRLIVPPSYVATLTDCHTNHLDSKV